MKKNYVIKIAKGELTLHKSLSIIYDYSNDEALLELAYTIINAGQKEPVIINQKNEVISGGRRLKAAMLSDEIEFLDCIQVDGDLDENLSIIIHNQQRVKTTREKYNEATIVLDYLGNRQGERNDLKPNVFGVTGDRYEITGKVCGMSASALRQLFNVVSFHNESAEQKSLGLLDKVLTGDLAISRADSIAKAHRKITTERANLKPVEINYNYTSEDYTIYNKSCLDMSELATGSIQTTITSIPYFQIRNYGNGQLGVPELGHEPTVDIYINNVLDHLKEVHRVTKSTGSFFLNIGESYQNNHAMLVPDKLAIALCENGWFMVNKIIWHKKNSIPQSNTRRLKPTYEIILHLVKDPNNYFYSEFKIWNDNEIKLKSGPADRSTKRVKSKKSGLSVVRPYDRFKDFIDEQQLLNVHDVILGSNASSRTRHLKKLSDIDHPAVFPEYLPLLLIMTTSMPGDIILDNFAGSGTVGRTSLLLKRKFIAYEINENNCELMRLDLNSSYQESKQSECEEFINMAA